MTSRIQNRRDTAANWTSNNPTLAAGELGFESDSGLFKLGNGSTAWTSLNYAGGSSGYSTTATAAGTTTLTSSSNPNQFFTGTTTQTVVLPAVSGLSLGKQFTVYNISTGVVTVQSSGANNIFAQPANTAATYTVISTSGTGTSSWAAEFTGFFSGVTGSGSAVLATNPSISGATETNVTLAGTVTANSSAGVAGQVLTSTGTGVQWAAGSSDPTPTAFLLMGA
jgi:hypothetical protein